ncbi:MAG: hypothetical protein AVDCRST_MAG05-1853, partial [uncultured Rubrobacteraceae bacterium]
ERAPGHALLPRGRRRARCRVAALRGGRGEGPRPRPGPDLHRGKHHRQALLRAARVRGPAAEHRVARGHRPDELLHAEGSV